MAIEWAPNKIRINSIAPVIIPLISIGVLLLIPLNYCRLLHTCVMMKELHDVDCIFPSIAWQRSPILCCRVSSSPRQLLPITWTQTCSTEVCTLSQPGDWGTRRRSVCHCLTPLSFSYFLLSLTLSLPTHMCRCLVRCVSCCPRVLPTSQGVLCRWMAGRAYTDHRGSFRVRIEHVCTIIQCEFACNMHITIEVVAQ